MTKFKISLALGSSDRHAPLLEGYIDDPDLEIEYTGLFAAIN